MSTPGVILQHGSTAPPDRLGAWLDEHGVPYEVRHTGEGEIPDLTGVSFVVSLGSESSARDREPGWIPAEIDALRDAVAAGVPVLGLCFGGQALALALGGGVHRLAEPEIGWVAVTSSDPDVPEGPWAHYHYEVLEVPPGAREVARSPAGPAGFRLGPHLGVQFHPEVSAERMRSWVDKDPNLPAGLDREAVARDGERWGAAAGEQAARLFGAWFAHVPARV